MWLAGLMLQPILYARRPDEVHDLSYGQGAEDLSAIPERDLFEKIAEAGVTGSLHTVAVISAQDVSTPPSGLPVLAEC